MTQPGQLPNWHDEAFFGLHYDLHANATEVGLGRALTHEHLRERLARVRPDWVQCDCKGHDGYTSWPTRTGSTAPGMALDQLRVWRDVTRDLGIRLGAHYSGVWDARALELHPEWGRVDADGTLDPRVTCRLGPYETELMIPQLLEVVNRYGVDGFWVDGDNWASKPCWCERCRAEFRRRGGEQVPREAGDPGWRAWLAFHRDLFEAYVVRYCDAVHARDPECLVCSSWLYSVRQPDPVRVPVDYLSGDYDYSWGAVRASAEGRMLDGRGLSWDLMAWTFARPGQMDIFADTLPFVTKPALHLKQEAAEVVALGGAIMLYDQPRRDGRLVSWHQDVLAEVAAWCRARQEACFRTESASEAAVLHHAAHLYAYNEPLYNYGPLPVEGALHALLETGRSVDLLTDDRVAGATGRYRLVVVPEQTEIGPDLEAALEAFVRAGGHLLLSGAHLVRDHADLVGAEARGAVRSEPAHLPVEGRTFPVSGPWQPVRPRLGTQVWAEWLSGQEPGVDSTGEAAVTARALGKGAVVAVHGPIFSNYVRGHYPPLRHFVGGLVARLGIPWTVELEAPPRLELVARRRGGEAVLNLVNRGAAEALHPSRFIVNELLPVENVTLRVRSQVPPVSVALEPNRRRCEWAYENGWLVVHVPRVDIHEVLVLRWENP